MPETSFDKRKTVIIYLLFYMQIQLILYLQSTLKQQTCN